MKAAAENESERNVGVASARMKNIELSWRHGGEIGNQA
jgi:hypothetical protein